MSKIKALAEELKCSENEIMNDTQDKNVFVVDKAEWLVLTDDEANKYVKENIENSAWAFNASFIIENSKLPYEAEEMLVSFQEKECENANDTILALIDDIDKFVENAVDADGRGHFLSSYDSKERMQTIDGIDYYIYKN